MIISAAWAASNAGYSSFWEKSVSKMSINATNEMQPSISNFSAATFMLKLPMESKLKD